MGVLRYFPTLLQRACRRQSIRSVDDHGCIIGRDASKGWDVNRPPPQFWSVLAGLRFLLAIWVLFDHTYNFGPADRAMPVFTKSGLMAVMCFFVISGFSIHHSIETNPVGYGRRRFWRIFPVHAISIGIGWSAWSVLGFSGSYATPQIPPTTWEFLGYFLLLEAFVPLTIPFFFPSWSLSIEVLYYICAPLLKRFGTSQIIPALMIASCSLFVAWSYIRDQYIALAYGFAAFALLWAWLGGWVAYARPNNRVYLAGLIVGGLVSLWTQAKYFAIVDIESAAGNAIAWMTVLGVVFWRLHSGASARVCATLDYLGEISYPLYLLHYPVLFALTSSILKAHPEFNYGIVQVAVALGSAVIAHSYVEKPLRAYSAFTWPRVSIRYRS
jgi:peptidoglycan/LPS O-acetylase OafA/YrhL